MTLRFNKIWQLAILFFLGWSIVACGPKKTEKDSKKEYESIENDPTNTRIYTLKNGLKVYLSICANNGPSLLKSMVPY
jgi:hypothetical protein